MTNLQKLITGPTGHEFDMRKYEEGTRDRGYTMVPLHATNDSHGRWWRVAFLVAKIEAKKSIFMAKLSCQSKMGSLS